MKSGFENSMGDIGLWRRCVYKGSARREPAPVRTGDSAAGRRWLWRERRREYASGRLDWSLRTDGHGTARNKTKEEYMRKIVLVMAAALLSGALCAAQE